MPPWLVPAFAVAAAARGWRAIAGRRAAAAYASRFTVGPDGVVQGAESFTLRVRGAPALLLLHGSGDTPQTLRYLGERLHDAGYTVHAPLLPGHGRSAAAFADVDATRYVEAAGAGLDLLRGESSWIGIVGLSMGGALAAQLAAEASDVRALALLAPYMEPPPLVRWVARTSWLWGAVVPFLDGRGEGSVHDKGAQAESRAYGFFSPSALRALVRTAAAGQRALARVAAPTLVVHSRQDIRIPVAIAERATAALRAPTERHWVSGCGHVITVDYCRREVAELVLAFLARLEPRQRPA
jgi:carboxylesterase